MVRSALAAKAFATPAATRKLNTITMPRIEERYTDLIDGFEAEGKPAVVVEYSVFRNRQQSLAYGADVVMAVLAPLETRIERAVASGFRRRTCALASLARSPMPTASRQPTWSSTTTAPRRAPQRGPGLVERV
ncbi:MAG: dephospho-CoA kinase [Adlercreutzia equolifaciens]